MCMGVGIANVSIGRRTSGISERFILAILEIFLHGHKGLRLMRLGRVSSRDFGKHVNSQHFMSMVLHRFLWRLGLFRHRSTGLDYASNDRKYTCGKILSHAYECGGQALHVWWI